MEEGGKNVNALSHYSFPNHFPPNPPISPVYIILPWPEVHLTKPANYLVRLHKGRFFPLSFPPLSASNIASYSYYGVLSLLPAPGNTEACARRDLDRWHASLPAACLHGHPRHCPPVHNRYCRRALLIERREKPDSAEPLQCNGSAHLFRKSNASGHDEEKAITMKVRFGLCHWLLVDVLLCWNHSVQLLSRTFKKAIQFVQDIA